MQFKTLVVDFDDTLSFTTNRDWVNAKPNKPLIEKLNKLFEEGWKIHIVTARGQLSCNGDSVLAEKTYGNQIKEWLLKHGVQHTSLSFEKKLATYYIDDKGITPENFIDQFNMVELKAGLSGASVIYDEYNKLIHKTANNTKSVVEWFKHATEKNYLTPVIHKVIGDTITMDAIEGSYVDENTYARAKSIASSFKYHNPIIDSTTGRMDYIDRCISRIKNDFDEDTIWHISKSVYDGMVALEDGPTFSHGDFSRKNLIVDKNSRIYMIDPILDPTLYSNWEIDVAKLQFSFMIDDLPINDTIKVGLVLSHACRVLPYTRNDNTTYGKCKKLILKLVDMYKEGMTVAYVN